MNHSAFAQWAALSGAGTLGWRSEIQNSLIIVSVVRHFKHLQGHLT